MQKEREVKPEWSREERTDLGQTLPIGEEENGKRKRERVHIMLEREREGTLELSSDANKQKNYMQKYWKIREKRQIWWDQMRKMSHREC